MSEMASQITSRTTVYSTVYSGADQNIKAPRHWAFWGNSPVAENVSIWWRYHKKLVYGSFMQCPSLMRHRFHVPNQQANAPGSFYQQFTCRKNDFEKWQPSVSLNCPACLTYEIATRSWDVVSCPIYMCLTVYEFSFISFDLCLFITMFNFILNYVLIVTFWICTYHKIWIMIIIYCFVWNYWIIHFVTCLELLLGVMS